MSRDLGWNVVAYGPYVTAEAVSALGIALVDLVTLLWNSDVISINVPLMESTLHMIGEGQLKMMKKTAFLINAARGAVVDEKALKEKSIAGAALDVLEDEPPSVDNPLLKLDNVVITPHIAWNTKEAKHKSQEAMRQ